MNEDDDEQRIQQWYDRKTAMMEATLGRQHNVVSHAIVPFAVGGGLDLYYSPNGVPGTAVATKELCEDPDEGPSNEAFDLYELVMFTKHELSIDHVHDESTALGRALSNIGTILNPIALYSAHATLNPKETLEFPEEMDTVGGKCLVFDACGEAIGEDPTFGLLAVIEVFRSEMNFVREAGSGELFGKLKEAGHYPYSDLDRKPVA